MRYEVIRYQRQKPKTSVVFNSDNYSEVKDFLKSVINTFQGQMTVMDTVKNRGILSVRSFDIGKNPRRKKSQKNPSTRTLIYGKVLAVNAQKTNSHKCDAACKRYGHRYKHSFKTGAHMYGLANGDLLITAKKR